MDVVYGPYIQAPRRLILDVYHRQDGTVHYEPVSEGEGCGGEAEEWLWATKEEWLEWLTKFQDEMTGLAYREAQDRVRKPLVEPKSWAGFRERYKTTGCPWL